eukprot:SAG31_NODE_7847_length_1583_cov_1.880054_1_plen_123_part_00
MSALKTVEESLRAICEYLVYDEEKSARCEYDDDLEAAGIDSGDIENVPLSKLCAAAPEMKNHIYYHVRVLQEHLNLKEMGILEVECRDTMEYFCKGCDKLTLSFEEEHGCSDGLCGDCVKYL